MLRSERAYSRRRQEEIVYSSRSGAEIGISEMSPISSGSWRSCRRPRDPEEISAFPDVSTGVKLNVPLKEAKRFLDRVFRFTEKLLFQEP